HEVDEREGGSALATFGPGEEMKVPGRVAVWDPPNRIVFDGGEDAGPMAFEWLVEARDGGSCVVRLVNSGYGVGDEWDDQYDAMTEGWQLFMANLKLHMEHFAGQSATPSIPIATWEGTRDEAWKRLLGGLGIETQPTVGERITLAVADGPSLSGTVTEAAPHHVLLVVDEPAPGTAFVAAEGVEGALMVSVWSYLYGDAGAAAANRDEPRWSEWLTAGAPAAT
ncbi:MAG: SRPBCC family protein, partial [Microthrixaceae bacterium]